MEGRRLGWRVSTRETNFNSYNSHSCQVVESRRKMDEEINTTLISLHKYMC